MIHNNVIDGWLFLILILFAGAVCCFFPKSFRERVERADLPTSLSSFREYYLSKYTARKIRFVGIAMYALGAFMFWILTR